MTGEFTGGATPWEDPADGALKQRVLTTVVDLLCQLGLRATDLDVVAGLAGVSGSWLREYFADIEALVAEVVRVQVHVVFASPGRRLLTAASPGELYRWRDGVMDGYRATRRSIGYPLGIVVYELTGHDGPASAALAASLGPWQSALADVFARLRDRGELAAGAQPAALATAVMGVLVGAMGWSRKTSRPDDVLEPFDMMLRHVLTEYGR